MNTIEYKLFPSLIMHFEEVLSENENDIVCDYINQNKKSLYKHKDVTGENSFSSFGKENFFLSNDLFKNLRKIISDKCLEYSNKTGFDLRNELKNSWFNVQHKNSLLMKHAHPLSVISGVYFVKTDEQSYPLFFHNPNPFIINTAVKNRTEYTYEWFQFKPKKKDLILFPGWISHDSNSVFNLSDERVIISFNVI